MNEKIDYMRSLAWKIAERQKKRRDVTAVLLFGSVAKGNIHPESDIDLAVVKETQEDLIERTELTREGEKVDLWEHSFSFYEDLFEQNWKPIEMFKYSLFLNVLQECKILYERKDIFGEYRERARTWSWPEKCLDLIEDKLEY